MASKKNINNDYEINISQLLKIWWSFRKIVIFGTILVALLSTFILVISNLALVNHKQTFARVVIQGDLGEKNTIIISALNSREYIQESLDKLSLKLNPTDILNNLSIKNKTNPLKESLQDRIISLTNKDISKLAISSEALSSIFKNLNDNSENIIEIIFYYTPLNITFEQARYLLNEITNNVNKKIILRVNRDDNNLRFINTFSVDNLKLNNIEKLTNYSYRINVIQNNLEILKENYKNILINEDLANYSFLANVSQKMLHELSKSLGNSLAVDTLNINIKSKNRDIEDLKTSLEILNKQQISNYGSNNKENNASANDSSVTNTQLDSAFLDRILSIGSTLDLNKFRLETVSKIQELKIQRSNLIKQKDLLNLPSNISINNLNLNTIGKRIDTLAVLINLLVKQVNEYSKPKAALEIITNPELVILKSSAINDLIKYVLILSLLTFLILSIISFLRPSR